MRNQFPGAPQYKIIRSSRLLAAPAAITTDSALYIPSPPVSFLLHERNAII